MRVTNRFTIAIHLIIGVDFFGQTTTVTSRLLGGSIGVSSVIVRQIMGRLKDAGIVLSSQGRKGITLGRPLEEITFYDVSQAVGCFDEESFFHFHDEPCERCPVGRHIHAALDPKLERVQRAMEEEMKRITLADVTDSLKEALRVEEAAETGSAKQTE